VRAVDRAVRPWRAEVLRPLRAARRAMKHPLSSEDAEARERVRRRLAAVELEVERLAQQAIVAAAGEAAPAGADALPAGESGRGAVEGSGADLAAANLALYVAVAGATRGDAVESDLRRLAGASQGPEGQAEAKAGGFRPVPK